MVIICEVERCIVFLSMIRTERWSSLTLLVASGSLLGENANGKEKVRDLF